MSITRRTAAGLAAALGLWACGTAVGAQTLDEFLTAIASADKDVRGAACEAAAAQGAPAVEPLATLMTNENRDVGRAATAALRKIANRAVRPGAARAERNAVAAALVKLLDKSRPAVVREEALYLLSLVGGDGEVPMIAPLLRDAALREPACDALIRVPGKAADEALIRALDAAAPEFRPRVAAALGQRRAKAAVSALVPLALGADKDLAAAATNALANIGEPAPDVFSPKTLTAQSDAELARLADAYVLYARNRTAAGDAASALPICTALLARGKADHLRVAAIGGIADAGRFASELPTILPLTCDESPSVQAAAIQAIARLNGVSLDGIAAAAAKARPCERAALLRAMDALGTPQATAKLADYLDDADGDVRVTAFELLSAAPPTDAALAQRFLKAATQKTGPEPIASLAMAGYLRIADAEMAASHADKALPMYEAALENATGREARVAALKGLGTIADPALADRVRAAMTSDAADAAAQAYINIALAVARGGDKARAGEMLVEAASRGTTGPAVDRAVAELHKLGIDTTGIACKAGFVADWWLIGPFPNEKKSAYETAYFPEKKVDLAAGGTVGDRELRWEPARIDTVPAIVVLISRYKPNQNVVAYGYAEITSAADQPVKLKLGSDDGVVAWLNGERVFATNADRGLRVDEDVVETRLKKGRNTLLVKVLQGSGDWQFCVRITRPDDTPLDLSTP